MADTSSQQSESSPESSGSSLEKINETKERIDASGADLAALKQKIDNYINRIDVAKEKSRGDEVKQTRYHSPFAAYGKPMPPQMPPQQQAEDTDEA